MTGWEAAYKSDMKRAVTALVNQYVDDLSRRERQRINLHESQHEGLYSVLPTAPLHETLLQMVDLGMRDFNTDLRDMDVSVEDGAPQSVTSLLEHPEESEITGLQDPMTNIAMYEEGIHLGHYRRSGTDKRINKLREQANVPDINDIISYGDGRLTSRTVAHGLTDLYGLTSERALEVADHLVTDGESRLGFEYLPDDIMAELEIDPEVYDDLVTLNRGNYVPISHVVVEGVAHAHLKNRWLPDIDDKGATYMFYANALRVDMDEEPHSTGIVAFNALERELDDFPAFLDEIETAPLFEIPPLLEDPDDDRLSLLRDIITDVWSKDTDQLSIT